MLEHSPQILNNGILEITFLLTAPFSLGHFFSNLPGHLRVFDAGGGTAGRLMAGRFLAWIYFSGF
jgi:hypothetical protein